ncbi:hypothetical protein Nepgr_025790 [Nepenthes gracilis]|uniref:Protein SLOW GREEN 1, chloroplastic n=1 Tax=Nepenthes gracilis TaxID=150966 RepID=A0AAD3T769_NEPGR|nr:hypothetical protein Nepgr_025790 [Nepenthes gracilis]
MDSALATSSTLFSFHKPYLNHTVPPSKQTLPSGPYRLNLFAVKNPHDPQSRFLIRGSSHSHHGTRNASERGNHPIAHTLKSAATTMVVTAVAALMIAKFNEMPARAESPTPPTVEKEGISDSSDSDLSAQKAESHVDSALTKLLESNSELLGNLKSLLQKNLENGEDEEALKILEKLVLAQPSEMEWKFLLARLLNEMGRPQDARQVFDGILASNPLSFEALFENALLMDRCGERDKVIGRLEEALRIAEDENKLKEARDVKLIMAQMQFLQKNVDEALRSYEELAKDDPKDFRPYFCKGMIYSLLDRNSEAREQFAKYRELSPKKFEVEGYLRTPLSRMKIFGTDAQNAEVTVSGNN